MAERTFDHIKADSFKQFYASAFKVRVNENDCAITFGIETEIVEGRKQIVDQAQIFTTLRSLKVLTLTLNDMLAHIENRLGPIQLPPGKIEELQSAIKESGEPPPQTGPASPTG